MLSKSHTSTERQMEKRFCLSKNLDEIFHMPHRHEDPWLCGAPSKTEGRLRRKHSNGPDTPGVLWPAAVAGTTHAASIALAQLRPGEKMFQTLLGTQKIASGTPRVSHPLLLCLSRPKPSLARERLLLGQVSPTATA